MSYAGTFFRTAAQICQLLDTAAIERLADELVALREREGRLFLLGVGGSAGNCGHAVNDFRKLCFIEAYAPTDNVSELTARTNDEGWDTVFTSWLQVSRLMNRDAILVFSVGGGDVAANVSVNIVKAIDYARSLDAKVFGVVGRAEGYTARQADVAVVVPPVDPQRVTPFSEAFQAMIWHCLVSHPKLQVHGTVW
jgi:D-sedoheptulose 7-phosphate isomerase